MKTATQRTATMFAAAAALVLSAGLATPSLAEGDGAGWRYDQYLAEEAAQRKAAAETRQTDRQKAVAGATEFEGAGSDHRTERNGAQRFYIDVPGWEEDNYRGM